MRGGGGGHEGREVEEIRDDMKFYYCITGTYMNMLIERVRGCWMYHHNCAICTTEQISF